MIAVVLWAIGPALAIATTPANLPNVVVFLVDDMGVMDTSVPFLSDASGAPKRHPLNDYYHTPHMERLAEKGIRFSNFYAMSVCSPSRISLLTGQNAARHRTTNWINPETNNRGPAGPPAWDWNGLDPADLTLPRLLQQLGYRTIHIGKGHFGPHDSPAADPRNLGFDVNIAGDAWGAPGSYYGRKNYSRANRSVPGLEKYHGTNTFLTEALTLEATAEVTEAVEAKQPFFLYLSHFAVHSPFQSDPRFAHHYEDSNKSATAQAYATLIEGVDKSLGDVLDHLEALHVADDTLILFLGDNGTDAPLGHEHEVARAAPHRGRKGSHYEGGMRAPLIAAWAHPTTDNPHQQRFPIAEGRLQPQIATISDIFPTLLALVDRPPPTGHPLDGISLATQLRGEKDPHRNETFLMHYPHAPHRSNYFTCYRDGAWKVVYHYFPFPRAGNSHYELFHLTSDPSESNNLAAEKPGQLEMMMQGLIESLQRHDALYPIDRDTSAPIKPKLP